MDRSHESIGLLFVHGMGEQKRWEHLKSSVLDLAEIMRQAHDLSSVTVVDRTDEWDLPPGTPHPEGLSPITLDYRCGDARIRYECFEVFWADLGTASGLTGSIAFWLWGLGQWSAPIYRELNAAQLPAGTTITAMPTSVAGDLRKEPLARLQLLMAAVAAIFLVCTWSLAKRVIGALIGKVPLPTLLVQYIGDVRTYEARAAPGDTSVTDPGHPRRVGIRRRMIAQMVAMGARDDLHGWYVLAHSLGTIVAYNGLTETGQALPNYLRREQWEDLPPRLKEDGACKTRQDVHAMMPSRPPWLADTDVINRPRLFAGLRGLLTYGSPLDKFAGLWPRIVATGTDRLDGQPIHPQCAWVNLASPADPVAGTLESFPAAPGEKMDRAIPQVRNFRSPWSWRLGLSHILYFKGFERDRRNEPGPAQKIAVAKWLLGGELSLETVALSEGRKALAFLAYAAMIAILWLAASVLATLVATAADRILGDWFDFDLGWWGFLSVAGLVGGCALALALLMGVLRWARESGLDEKLARHDRKGPAVIATLRRQKIAATVLGSLGLLLILLSLALDLGLPEHAGIALPNPFGNHRGPWTLIAATIGTGIVAWTQAIVNHRAGRPASART